MKCKIALCQMRTRPDVQDNYDACKTLLAEAGRQGADIAILPEIWTTRITPKTCLENAEDIGGPAYTLMQAAAKVIGNDAAISLDRSRSVMVKESTMPPLFLTGTAMNSVSIINATCSTLKSTKVFPPKNLPSLFPVITHWSSIQNSAKSVF